MKIKDAFFGILALLLIVGLVIFVYNFEQGRNRHNLARRIAEMSPRSGPPQSIEELQSLIAIYEAQIERNIQDAAQTGAYWKILATRFAEQRMHRDALNALEQAIRFNTEDPALFFRTGESAAAVAAATLGFSPEADAERDRFFSLAESAYLRAIQLDATFPRPLLGLGILYTFDLNRPQEAIPHLERYLQLLPNNIEGMFVLARAYVMTNDFQRAIDLYDRIITRSRDANARGEAQRNIDTLRDRMNG